MIAAGGEEQCVWHADDHVEAEDADVEIVHALDVRRLQMDVADSRACRDRPWRALGWGDPLGAVWSLTTQVS